MFNASQFIARQQEIDSLWAAGQLHALPRRFRAGLLKQREKLNKGGDYAGNVYIRSLGASFKYPASLAASNDELIAQAETRANECAKISTVRGMAEICARFGVELPQARFRADGAACYVAGVVARLKCPLWWRRQLRKVAGREIERIAIDLGFVHRRAGCYASDETVDRRKQQKARNRALLESIKAVNENGQEYTLAELSALGVSNPAIRRGELMTRISGFENIALNVGHVGVFYTVTAPSRFHARHSKSGLENDKYKRETPRQAQTYLCGVWARQRAALSRAGIRLYGFRVAEAHHDGTPHWHILVFVAPHLQEAATAIMQKYAIAEDREELGADITPRFKVEIIDQKRGTAAGYIAKYISKNIDGHGLEDDKSGILEGVEAVSGAERVDAWASAWGIRQFQQIGGAPVSVWRELRRLEAGASDTAIDRAARAADLGDWAGFLMVMGGAVAKRADMPVGMWKKTADRAGRYGDMGRNVLGVVEAATGEAVQTRVHVWEIKRGVVDVCKKRVFLEASDFMGEVEAALPKVCERGGFLGFEVGPILAPWSPVNNCTQKRGGEGGFTKKHVDGDAGSDGKNDPGIKAVRKNTGFHATTGRGGDRAFDRVGLWADSGGSRPSIGGRKTEKSGAAGEGC